MQQTEHTPAAPAQHDEIRDALLQRRARLHAAEARSDTHQVLELLGAVDAALERLDAGSFGICELCHDPIEHDMLTGDPLVRVCLACLSSEQRRALERDLEHAAAIQAHLLPPRDFSEGGWDGHYVYRPHGAVSGDFCDVIHNGEATLVMVGDVSGKGVSAALLMSHLHAVFRGLAESGSSLREMMDRANRMFGAVVPAGSFSTLVAARLMRDGRVEISNAGHVPPLYHNGRVHRLPPDGIPLGLFRETTYTSQTLDLKPGERLVLATDGLVEATDPNQREYGLDALASTIASLPDAGPRRLAELLIREVERFRDGQLPADDTTLMVVRRLA